MPRRNVTPLPLDPRERYALYRLCDCPTCDATGKGPVVSIPYASGMLLARKRAGTCPDCRGEGRIRQEVASCESPEAVGVALVTLARGGEFEECPLGLLDRMGESGQKWLILPWMPSARNVRDAARTLARSKKTSR